MAQNILRSIPDKHIVGKRPVEHGFVCTREREAHTFCRSRIRKRIQIVIERFMENSTPSQQSPVSFGGFIGRTSTKVF